MFLPSNRSMPRSICSFPSLSMRAAGAVSMAGPDNLMLILHTVRAILRDARMHEAAGSSRPRSRHAAGRVQARRADQEAGDAFRAGRKGHRRDPILHPQDHLARRRSPASMSPRRMTSDRPGPGRSLTAELRACLQRLRQRSVIKEIQLAADRNTVRQGASPRPVAAKAFMKVMRRRLPSTVAGSANHFRHVCPARVRRRSIFSSDGPRPSIALSVPPRTW